MAAKPSTMYPKLEEGAKAAVLVAEETTTLMKQRMAQDALVQDALAEHAKATANPPTSILTITLKSDPYT